MRKDIRFQTEGGLTLRGWLYLPDVGGGPAPTVVMAHGFSAVKEMYLDRFGEVFADAGLAALVYDNRNIGASDGEPRLHLDPWEQVSDYRDAITFASTLPECGRRPDRGLGIELQRGSRSRGGRHRPPREVRGLAGHAGEWSPVGPAVGSVRPDCGAPGRLPGGPAARATPASRRR